MYSASAFRDKEPAQPTCTVYPPSSVRYRDIFSAKTVSLPPQANGGNLQCKTLSRTPCAPPMAFSTSYPVSYSELPQKLPAEGTGIPTVQRGKLPRQGNPTFFSKLSRQLPVYDTLPSSIRYRRKIPGYGTQPSLASYPKLRGQATQASSARHQCLQWY